MPVQLTEDTLFNGKVAVTQFKTGYRFSIDAILLAGFVTVKPKEHLLDLGCGCGVIPLILAHRHKTVRMIGCELQKELALLAKANIRQNGLEERVRILHRDMRDLTQKETGGAMDVIVCNPPFYTAPSGRVNRNTQKTLARHEIGIRLQELLSVTKSFLNKGGWLYLIYPANQLVRLFGLMREFAVEPKKVRMVHSTVDTGAKLALVCGKAGANAGLKFDAPLIIYDAKKRYTQEVQALFNG